MSTLIDTGPLVALINRRDVYHAWTVEQAGRLGRPSHTCEAVLTEAYFLVQRMYMGVELLHQLIESGQLGFPFSRAEHQGRVLALMRRYENVPMSFADACLVCMAELDEDASVFTTDRDF